jgi:hypothetical protein
MSSAGDRVSSKAGRSKPRSLAARIQVQYASLPGSERKVADLILDFPGEIAAYSDTELAELAGASKAAVTRLIRRLGYASFEQARHRRNVERAISLADDIFRAGARRSELTSQRGVWGRPQPLSGESPSRYRGPAPRVAARSPAL